MPRPPADYARATGIVERLLREIPWFRVAVRAAEARLISEVELTPPVLDLGAGDGSFAYGLRPDPPWIGIDPATAPLHIAQRLGIYRALVRAVGAPLPFRDAAFNAVISNSTLEHIPDVEPVIREMARVLRPGGTFVITVPSETFYDHYLGIRVLRSLRLTPLTALYRRWVKYTTRTHHAQSPAEWAALIERAGLEVVRTRYYWSQRDTAIMEIWHYISAPSLIVHRVLGRWVLWPGKARFLAPLLEPLTRPGETEHGAFVFLLCRKP